jgi:hypothetical protein
VLEERGFREKGSALNYLEHSIEDLFGNPAAQIWWKHHRESYPPEFAAAINHALVDVDTDANHRKLLAIQDELKGIAGE